MLYEKFAKKSWVFFFFHTFFLFCFKKTKENQCYWSQEFGRLMLKKTKQNNFFDSFL